MRIRLILVFITLICPLISIADNVKDAYLFQKVDYQQGLSNSAVLCLFQDNEGLMFITIPKVFASMGFGTFAGVMFFLLVLFAALTSSIALTESAVSTFEDELGWSRKKSTVLCGTLF